MTLRAAKVVAFDGSHASGKTTLLYSVASRLRAAGSHVTVLGEPARESPFVDDVVIHNSGSFDILLELDLFAAHITNCVRAARSFEIVLADKTPANVVAYTRMLVAVEQNGWDDQMLARMHEFSRTWVEAYDAIFLLQDHFREPNSPDRYRSKVRDLQEQADLCVRREYAALDVTLRPIPYSLDLKSKTDWVLNQMVELNILDGVHTSDY